MPSGCTHQRGLRGKRQLWGNLDCIRLTAENERTIDAGADGAKRPRLLACAAREADQIGNLLGAGDAPLDAGSKASGEWVLVNACRRLHGAGRSVLVPRAGQVCTAGPRIQGCTTQPIGVDAFNHG